MKSRLATLFSLVALVGGTGGAIAVGESGSHAGPTGGAVAAQYKPGKGCGKPSQHQESAKCKAEARAKVLAAERAKARARARARAKALAEQRKAASKGVSFTG